MPRQLDLLFGQASAELERTFNPLRRPSHERNHEHQYLKITARVGKGRNVSVVRLDRNSNEVPAS